MDSFSEIYTNEVSGITVNGRPLHVSTDKLKSLYQSSELEQFLRREKQESAGSYAVVDGKGSKVQIITSPAFCGGYYQSISGLTFGKTLRQVLSDIPREDIELKQEKVREYIVSGELYPLSTFVNGVSRLPPGSMLEISNQSVKMQSYIRRAESSHTLNEALGKCARCLDNCKKQITVMYSGGVDSTALYLALSEVIDNENLRAVTVDIGPNTNSIYRARQVGQYFDIYPEKIEFGWPPREKKVLNLLEDRMSVDITNPHNPHWALHTEEADQVVISGQNIDATLASAMHRPQTRYIDHIRATGDIRGIIKQWVKNIQYTSYYEEGKLLQWIYAHLIPLLAGSEYTGKHTSDGYYSGMMSSGYPNVMYRGTCTGGTIEELRDYANHLSSDLLRYLQYQHNAAKYIETYKSRAEVHLPAMWGPMLSYGLKKHRELREAFNPKRDIYEYIRKKTGIEYRDIAYENIQGYQYLRTAENKYKSREVKSPLLQRNAEYFDSAQSQVIQLTNSGKNDIAEYYNTIYRKIGGGMSFRETRTANRMLNLEMILRNV